MRKILPVLILVLLAFGPGCAIGPVNGILFTSTSFPGEFNAANDVPAVKSAKGCMHLILGLISFGDASAGTVAMDNNIKRIATIDHSTFNILQIVYSNYCTIVTGE